MVMLGLIILLPTLLKKHENLVIRCNKHRTGCCPGNECSGTQCNAGECDYVVSDLTGNQFRTVDVAGRYSFPAVMKELEGVL
jgi:hypothetical protein